MSSSNGHTYERWEGRRQARFGNRRRAVILAGGDGTRLRSLTRAISGDDRPKQFCRIFDGLTLLEQTMRRVELMVPADRTAIVVTERHERYYAPLLRGMLARNQVIQPENKGTTPAILYALLRVTVAAPDAVVGFFPSDHYVSDDAAFAAQLEAAFDAVEAGGHGIVLLGVEPDRPEPDYGWIDPVTPILGGDSGKISRVRRFWEKPAAPVARALMSRGGVWNSFVMVGQAATFLALINRAVPDLFDAFASATPALAAAGSLKRVAALYSRTRDSNFSQEVLAAYPESLSVLALRDVGWSDWGDPARVLSTLARVGIETEWAPALLARASENNANMHA